MHGPMYIKKNMPGIILLLDIFSGAFHFFSNLIVCIYCLVQEFFVNGRGNLYA